MRVILDTNILLSALISPPASPPWRRSGFRDDNACYLSTYGAKVDCDNPVPVRTDLTSVADADRANSSPVIGGLSGALIAPA